MDSRGRVDRRIHRAVLTVFLAIAVAGPWPFLQSVAWVKMFVSFSQTDTLTSALTKTFNGKNPCKLCHFVAKSKKCEQKQTVEFAKVKIDFFLVASQSFPIQLPEVPSTDFFSGRFSPPAFAPPLPPPRTA